MQIHQISLVYVPAEDRILVRVNTRTNERLQFFLTRRLMNSLYPELLRQDERLALRSAECGNPDKVQQYSQDAKRALADIKRDVSIQKTDFATPFVNQGVKSVTDAPLVITRVNIQLQTVTKTDGSADAQLLVSFDQSLPNQADCGWKFAFTPKLYHGFMQMVHRAIVAADWGFASRGAGNNPGNDPGHGGESAPDLQYFV